MDFLNHIVSGLRRYFQSKAAPQLVFSRFQEVLKSNNRALEIIADLGEKGSGEYIFDQHYIDQTLQELHETVATSIEALNSLCADRYNDLYTPLERLRIELDQILTGTEERHGPLVQGFDDIQSNDWGRIGGKAGHLVELRRESGLSVPPGFVITIPAFHHLIEFSGLRSQYDSFRRLCAGEGDERELERQRSLLAESLKKVPPPPEILTAIRRAILAMEEKVSSPFTLAVRSSGSEEDQDYSFAGQYHSELNVPMAADEVFSAYKKVVVSLFTESAVLYHRQILPGDGDLAIAACCQLMVSSRVSGVAYTQDPTQPLDEVMVIVGAWGYGAAVVEGQIATDTFRISKTAPPGVRERDIADKKEGLYYLADQTEELKILSEDERFRPCLTDSQLLELADQLILLENRYRRPLDVEWSFDEEGQLYILQARPLTLSASSLDRRQIAARLDRYELVSDGIGKVAQQGIGCGVVYHVETTKDLDAFPDNAVLISRRDSSRFVKVMSRAAALITETGTPVSHMATLCRELQVPCLVGVDGIMQKIRPGEEITVDADDLRIYRGRVVELLSFRGTSGLQLETSREFRLLRRLLKKVSLLHLVDPLMENFTVAGCSTYHDILRFVHETAVQELINVGRDENSLLRSNLARHLDLPVPVGIIVIDIGGGLRQDAPVNRVEFAAVASEPFRAILQGMLFPEVWHQVSMKVGMRDLMSSMLNTPNGALAGSYTGHNIAIIGASYVNLCFRLGYHFNIIDAYCSDNERDNHIYYRFLGGASDIGKRTRRTMMIEKILIEYDFRIKTRGDLLIARHGNLTKPDMVRILDILGRLVGFTRQLDVRLDSEAAIDYYAEAFLAGNYGVVSGKNKQ